MPEPKMLIMIRCPVTQKDLPTGIATTAQAFEATDYGLNSVSCPWCFQMHTWSKADAFLVPAPKRKAN